MYRWSGDGRALGSVFYFFACVCVGVYKTCFLCLSVCVCKRVYVHTGCEFRLPPVCTCEHVHRPV